MKKWKIILLSLLLWTVNILPVKAIELTINSQNAVLYNLDENKILYEKNADEVIPIASLTKIMTAIVALEKIDSLEEIITITQEDLKGLMEANASVAGFRINQKITYRDLLYGLLLPSGADAAKALTRNIAGSEEEFVALMNQKAKDLKLNNTQFKNATGLDEEGHHSTLKEVATIFKYALQNKEFKDIIESSSYTMSDKSFTVLSTLTKNLRRNNLSMNYLKGGKTGTTENAGLCLASIAEENGSNYMLITARATNNKEKEPYNFYDAQTIYEYFIENYQKQRILEKGEEILSLDTEYAKEENIKFYAEENLEKYLSKEFDKSKIEYKYDGIKTVTSKTKANTRLGTLAIYYQEEELALFPIILQESLHFDILKYMKAHPLLIIILIFIIILLSLLIKKKFRKKKCKKRK